MRRSGFFIVPFLMDASISMANLMVNFRALDLGATPSQVGLFGFAWGLPFALFSPFTGRLAAYISRRTILLIASAIYLLSVILYGLCHSPIQLILAAPLGGLASSLFWPSYETLLHHPNSEETHRNMGLFNVGWTLGLMSGSAAGGYVYRMAGVPWGIWSVAIFLLIAVGVLLWQTQGTSQEAGHEDEAETDADARQMPLSRRVGYLRVAWVANFMLFFGSTAASQLFPKLTRSLHIEEGPTGLLMAMVVLAQALSFAMLAKTKRWHYRMSPLVATQILTALGLLLMVVGASPLVFALGFGLIGFGRGLTYTASLYYALNVGGSHSANTGIHEGIIGSAMVLGPLLAGVSAEHVSLRAPFVLALGMIFLGLIAQWLMWRALPSHRATQGDAMAIFETRMGRR